MENDKKFIIWSNDLNFDEWKDELAAEYPDCTEEELIRIMYDTNEGYLEDEKLNLYMELENKLFVYGRIARWNGNRTGYKFLPSSNLNGIFSDTCGDYITWYVDGDNVYCDDCHHDGTNHYTYRVLKEEYTEDDFEDYAWEKGFEKAVNEMTKPLGPYVAEIYGLDLSDLPETKKDKGLCYVG